MAGQFFSITRADITSNEADEVMRQCLPLTDRDIGFHGSRLIRQSDVDASLGNVLDVLSDCGLAMNISAAEEAATYLSQIFYRLIFKFILYFAQVISFV